MRSRNRSADKPVPEGSQDRPAANPWHSYQPTIKDDLDALAETIGTIGSLVERLATGRLPSASPCHVLVEAHLLRLLAESVYWNVHDAERWRGAPRCGQVLRSADTLARPCGHEQDHDGTCTDHREDIDDIVERARALATAAGRADHGVASLSLAINRRRYDGAAVGAVARETLRTLPDRLLYIAQGALDLIERLDQSSDIQPFAWSPPPDPGPPVRTAARHTG